MNRISMRITTTHLAVTACVLFHTCSLIAQDTSEVLKRGEAVYRESCASCHGDQGQGVADSYPDPLIGDSTVGELTKYIGETMPEGEPEVCTDKDANAVAKYIHYSFYSEAARVRNRPPRIGLARLTAPQLQNSLADLYARHVNVMWPEKARGISAEYFDGARWSRKNRKIERVDQTIDFDFGNDGPGEKINPKDFAIFWRGGLFAETTGRYEIVIRSTCGFICSFGGYDREFINNRVQSGDKTEFRKSVNLIAGRVYPIKIDFYQRKRKTEQPPAKITLAWVPPKGIEEVIPARNLVPASVPATFALQTKLPPDDRSYGFDRGIAIDKQWDESTTAAAIEFANFATDVAWPFYNKRNRKKPNENRARLRQFLTETIEAAFRGPLSDELKTLYVDNQVDATEDNAEAIKRSLMAALKSPRFLYPGLDYDRTKSQRVANRLALTLFDGLPSDDYLRKRIAQDKLQTDDQVRAAARRLVSDFRVRGKMRGMLHEWLHMRHIDEITKDEELYPGFSREIVADLRQSLNAFLDEIVWSENSDYRELFRADWTMTTPRLTEFYGDKWQPAEEEGPTLRRSVSDPEHRHGVITHPFLLSGLAYDDSTSPIHRGVFLIRYMLGRSLRPPNAAFTPFSAELHPGLTTRERVELQTSPENCQGCHVKINGLGFTLENFDSVGKFREKEFQKIIDATGQYTTLQDETVPFANPGDLVEFLAT
ncbi:MAG: DUF1592 domain-containing protein, partial [Planctomycetaceae bacterium]